MRYKICWFKNICNNDDHFSNAVDAHGEMSYISWSVCMEWQKLQLQNNIKLLIIRAGQINN